MSHASELRGVLADLLLGARGTTRTITAGRFVEHAPDAPVDGMPADAAERRFEIVMMEGANSRPYNAIDGFKLARFDVTIRLTYSLTNAGGDVVESDTPQGGPGTLDAIRDRANSDRMEIERVLSWVENTYGVAVTGATMIGAYEKQDRPPSGASRGTVYVYEIFYEMLANVTAATSSVAS